MADFEQAKIEAQIERDEERAKLFLPVGNQVGDAEDGEEDQLRVVDEIESLCMNCEENGTTRLLLTKVPFFREIILMSFYCERCHFKNSEVQAAGEIQPKGTKYILKLEQTADMQRQVVKSDTATIRIEEIDIEIPPGRGRLTNIEGIMSEVMQDLEKDQGRRRKEHPELYESIEEIVQKLIKMMNGGAFPYTITVDDPAGNSWIEPSPIDAGSRYTRKDYNRTPVQNANLGLAASDDTATVTDATDSAASAGDIQVGKLTTRDPMEGVDIVEGETYTMPCQCPGCTRPAALNLQMVQIPYFKQVVISAVVCMHCGYKTNDVKTGGEVPELAKRITLKVHGPQDMKRDILKSETCFMKIPECNVELQAGTMGGRFTTVEGLLTQVRDDLSSHIFGSSDATGSAGDSMPAKEKKEWEDFFKVLDEAINAEIKFTVILEDPMAGSYVQSYMAPDPDPQISEEDYVRTAEEEEELGLTDMRTHLNDQGEYVKEETANTDASLAAAVASAEDQSLADVTSNLNIGSDSHSASTVNGEAPPNPS